MKGALYGEKGGAYPVQPGDVWQVGPHLVTCGDLEDGGGERFLAFARSLHYVSPSLFYTDPPWSPAFVTRFRTGAGLTREPTHTVESVCRRIARLAGTTPLLLEMGVSYDTIDVSRWLSQETPGTAPYCIPITYAGGKPAYLFGCNLTAVGGELLQALRGKDDEKIPALTLQAFTGRGDVVVDLCLGLGCTSRSAAIHGRVCWGLELHPRRCSASLADLEKLCGSDPQKIGRL